MRTANAIVQVMIKASEKAARCLRRDFGELENLQVALKGPADFVSRADRQSEKVLCEQLEEARPDFGFLTEESGEIEGENKAYRWIIDPLDGTTNFLHGIPFFSISIALEHNGVIIAALVHNPVTGEMFFAQKGGGAYLNDTRLRVAKRHHLDNTVIAMTIPHLGHDESQHQSWQKIATHFMAQTSGIRSLGSSALDLAFVAAGRFDGYIASGLSWWDCAAGCLLVQEAGGMIGSWSGKTHLINEPDILASNTYLYPQILSALQSLR